jgi:hypothetical protein
VTASEPVHSTQMSAHSPAPTESSHILIMAQSLLYPFLQQAKAVKKERRYGLKTHHSCLSGKEVVDILGLMDPLLSRKQAEDIGGLWLSQGVLKHLPDSPPVFTDSGSAFYGIVEKKIIGTSNRKRDGSVYGTSLSRTGSGSHGTETSHRPKGAGIGPSRSEMSLAAIDEEGKHKKKKGAHSHKEEKRKDQDLADHDVDVEKVEKEEGADEPKGGVSEEPSLKEDERAKMIEDLLKKRETDAKRARSRTQMKVSDDVPVTNVRATGAGKPPSLVKVKEKEKGGSKSKNEAEIKETFSKIFEAFDCLSAKEQEAMILQLLSKQKQKQADSATPGSLHQSLALASLPQTDRKPERKSTAVGVPLPSLSSRNYGVDSKDSADSRKVSGRLSLIRSGSANVNGPSPSSSRRAADTTTKKINPLHSSSSLGRFPQSDLNVTISYFGSSLPDIMKQEKEIGNDTIPSVLSFLVTSIFRFWGAGSEDLFLPAADHEDIDELKNLLNKTPLKLWSEKITLSSPHQPATLLKRWLLDLSDPLFPVQVFRSLLVVVCLFDFISLRIIRST